jgi:hypothetical protein
MSMFDAEFILICLRITASLYQNHHTGNEEYHSAKAIQLIYQHNFFMLGTKLFILLINTKQIKQKKRCCYKNSIVL